MIRDEAIYEVRLGSNPPRAFDISPVQSGLTEATISGDLSLNIAGFLSKGSSDIFLVETCAPL